MRPDAIVCHPGPINRGVEFASYMPDHPERSVILDQVYAGICVRMAALYLLLGGCLLYTSCAEKVCKHRFRSGRNHREAARPGIQGRFRHRG